MLCTRLEAFGVHPAEKGTENLDVNASVVKLDHVASAALPQRQAYAFSATAAFALDSSATGRSVGCEPTPWQCWEKAGTSRTQRAIR